MPVDPRQWLARFDALSLRERGLITLALGVLLLQGGGLLLDTARNDLLGAQQALSAQHRSLQDIERRLRTLTQGAGNAPNEQLHQRRLQLRRDLTAAERRLDQLSQRLVAPEAMASLLQQMLERQPGLELIRLETLGTRPVEDDAQSQGTTPLFAHDLVLEFRGGYLDILRYLQRLESLSAGIHWDGFHLEAEEWPSNRVRLRLHTLSLSEDWIGA